MTAPLQITVHVTSIPALPAHATVGQITGRVLPTGEPVSVAVEHRYYRAMRAAFASGETILALVEPWQIIGSHN